MNLPNRITLARIFLIPFFMALLLSKIPYGKWLAAAVFIIAALTDSLDGYLARSSNQITDLGKVLDPLADKLIVAAALIVLVQLGQLSSWIVVIIIAREFGVSGLRIMAAAKNKIVAASFLGKAKTLSQSLAVIFWIFKIGQKATWVNNTAWILMVVAVILTLYSGFDYFMRLKKVLEGS